MNDFDKLQHIIGLTQIERVGDVLAKRLIAHCGGAQQVFDQKANRLLEIPGIGDFVARMLKQSKKALKKAEDEINYCIKHNIKIYSFLDEKYPQRLKYCEDGPAILFVKGKLDLNPKRIVNIIGTRIPTAYGKEFTETLTNAIGTYDVTVVSGMAYGIDITAHKTCLKNKIPTVGVVAHGLDTIYPSTHKNIFQEICENGAAISEHFHGISPDKENFPKRNRIVAGMCDATIVIETDVKGGSMITARLANDYNRDVFALPGKPFEKTAKGCNFLIKSNRAALFESIDDIVNIMGWDQKKNDSVQTSLFIDLDEEEKQIASLLKQKGKLMIDVLSVETQQPVSKVSVTLLNMEFKGAVRSLPGKLYELVG